MQELPLSDFLRLKAKSKIEIGESFLRKTVLAGEVIGGNAGKTFLATALPTAEKNAERMYGEATGLILAADMIEARKPRSWKEKVSAIKTILVG